jgi:hypothetical protein
VPYVARKPPHRAPQNEISGRRRHPETPTAHVLLLRARWLKLIRRGWLEPAQPEVELIFSDCKCTRGQIRIAPGEPGPQLVAPDLEVAQLHPRAQRLGLRSVAGALLARPKAPLQHHIDPKRQYALGDLPLNRLNRRAQTIELGRVCGVGQQQRDPFVGRQAQRRLGALKLPGERGLAGARQAADQKQRCLFRFRSCFRIACEDQSKSLRLTVIVLIE